jgi:hypothetical protein
VFWPIRVSGRATMRAAETLTSADVWFVSP